MGGDFLLSTKPPHEKGCPGLPLPPKQLDGTLAERPAWTRRSLSRYPTMGIPCKQSSESTRAKHLGEAPRCNGQTKGKGNRHARYTHRIQGIYKQASLISTEARRSPRQREAMTNLTVRVHFVLRLRNWESLGLEWGKQQWLC